MPLSRFHVNHGRVVFPYKVFLRAILIRVHSHLRHAMSNAKVVILMLMPVPRLYDAGVEDRVIDLIILRSGEGRVKH
jgi:hypothetical protein